MATWHPDDTLTFATWAQSLRLAPFDEAMKHRYQVAIIGYLRWCKTFKFSASVASARQFLETPQGSAIHAAREALRWLFAAARKADAVERRSPGRPRRSSFHLSVNKEIPRQAHLDLGNEEWEKRLIQAIRNRQFLWRTEQAYRAWLRRFAKFVRPSSPLDATDDDLRRFLSHLATVERVSATTQRQALNSLVFFIREALLRPVGDVSAFVQGRRVHREVALI